MQDAAGRAIVDPVLCIVEAKKADVDSRAFGQCMATMVAAQRFNQHQSIIFGCVTTGNDWQFLRLTEDLFEIDPETYYENQLPVVLGVLISFLRSEGAAAAK